jgi:exopolysaccharide biosynthesis polyprenyl glycosylphosphotransferase
MLDALVIWAAFWLAYLLRYRLEIGGGVRFFDDRPFSAFYGRTALFVAFSLIALIVRGVYRLPRWTSLLDEMMLIGACITVAMSAVILTAYLSRFTPSRLVFIYAWVFSISLLFGARVIRRHLRAALWNRNFGVQRVLIVGSGNSGRRVMQALLATPSMGLRVAGYVDDPTDSAKLDVGSERGVVRANRLGSLVDIPTILRRIPVDEVILALPSASHAQALEIADWCRSAGIPFKVVPDLLQLSLDRVRLAEIQGVPLLSVREASIRGFNRVIKRSMDLLISTFAIVVAFIPIAVISLLIKLDSKGPSIYRQARIGRSGVPFTVLKFRCMSADADETRPTLIEENGDQDPRLFKLRSDPRLTGLGAFLRRWSLDELPQLVNVWKGEMSLVGPRPQLPAEVAQYEDWQRQRLMVTPGMTGLWQVNGRSDLTFDEMVRLDLYYAENWSPWLDAKIVLRTIPAVLLGKGAY